MHTQKHLISPEYWDGHDIRYQAAFINQTPIAIHDLMVSPREQEKVSRKICEKLGAIATKTTRESAWIVKEFEPKLANGTLVIFDRERVSHRFQHPYSLPNIDSFVFDDESPSSLSEAWLEHQEDNLPWSTKQIVIDGVLYERELRCGILATSGQKTFLSSFSFDAFHIAPDTGEVITSSLPENTRCEKLPLPCSIQQVQVQHHASKNDGRGVDRLERIKALSVIESTTPVVRRSHDHQGILGFLASCFSKSPR